MSALDSSVVSAATTVGARLFQWGIVLGGKNASGHHYRSGACNTVSCVMTWWILFSEMGQVLVFINRHNPTMNLVEEKQRGLIPPGLQSWPLQLIEHLANTASVAPPPAGPAGCRPLYLLHLLNLSFATAEQIDVHVSHTLDKFYHDVSKFVIRCLNCILIVVYVKCYAHIF